MTKLPGSVLLLLLSPLSMANQQMQTQKAALGKLIFNDTSLSQPAGQSCQSCHQTAAAYSDPNNIVSPGATPTLFGNRNAPSISYVKYNPVLHWDLTEKTWVGGFFYDGRSTNLHSQAKKPFINPLEMGNSSITQVIAKVKESGYASMLQQLYGKDLFEDEDDAIDAITDALVAYEQGPEFAPFSAKYDHYLKGNVSLSKQELLGLEVFEAEDKGNCAACHPSQPESSRRPPLFTDYTYDNIGLAANHKLPFLNMATKYNPAGKGYVDQGLAGNPNIDNPELQVGKFKVPTLRNIAKTAPYMHNGIFDNLEDVVDFYNSRDIDKRWGVPEVKATVNHEELGDLKLSEIEVKALVAFMKTLSDGYEVPAVVKGGEKSEEQVKNGE
ncbi:MAG: methylamine utilization protein mauG [Algicola sp.]|nr:methylamine utilization protein mauG [Algicola sp.]